MAAHEVPVVQNRTCVFTLTNYASRARRFSASQYPKLTTSRGTNHKPCRFICFSHRSSSTHHIRHRRISLNISTAYAIFSFRSLFSCTHGYTSAIYVHATYIRDKENKRMRSIIIFHAVSSLAISYTYLNDMYNVLAYIVRWFSHFSDMIRTEILRKLLYVYNSNY